MPATGIFPFTGTAPSLQAALWDGVPYQDAAFNPKFGAYEHEDFINYNDAEMEVTALNSGASESFNKVTLHGGARRLTVTTAADHRGVQVLLPALGSYQPAAGRLIVQDWAVNLTQCSTFFIGLVEPGATVFDASSVLPTTSSWIGIYRLNGGVVQFVSRDETTTDVADAVSLLAASYYHALTAGESEPTRIGFRIEGRSKVRVAIDGESFEGLLATAFNPLSIPTEVLTPAIAIARGATADETSVTLDVLSYDGYVK